MGKRIRESEESEISDTKIGPNNIRILKKARKETKNLPQRTLFVRSLPSTATSDDLTAFFSENYPIKHATVVLDVETKKSKGYGFVTFTDPEDAKKALEDFNRSIFQGQKLKIELAEPRSREVVVGDELGRKRTSRISGEAAAIKRERKSRLAIKKGPPKLIIRNLPWSIKTPEQLGKLFETFGKVKCSFLPNIRKNTQAGFGFVVMRSRKDSERAISSMNNTVLDGRTIAVDWAVDKRTWENLRLDDSKNQDIGNLEQKEKTNPSEETSYVDEANNIDSGVAGLDEQVNNDVENFLKIAGRNLEPEDKSNYSSSRTSDGHSSNSSGSDDESLVGGNENANSQKDENENIMSDNKTLSDISTTLFIRNLPFDTLDENLREHFKTFGPIRYARVVIDRNTGRSKGTGFVCFYKLEDANSCYHGAPRIPLSGSNAIKVKHSLLEDESADLSGMYTIEGRILQVSRAVDREDAVKLTENSANFRADRDKDKRKLYLLKEGTISADTPLYNTLSKSEIKMREDSALQRKKLVQKNPALHLSLTRLSVRNIPRHITSKELKVLARQAIVGFAMDVKSGLRSRLSREEELRGGDEDRVAEQQRKIKGKGIVRQAKIIFEGREGSKIAEDSGAGNSRGYGFVEYYSHRWALMGLRWMNGHAIKNKSGKMQRLIVEFAIENAQVVQRRKKNQEKARLRSEEVLKARQKEELPIVKKKILTKNQEMKKMRMEGKNKQKKQQQIKSLERTSDKTILSYSRDQQLNRNLEKCKTQKNRGQIIQRKRILRKAKKQKNIK